jgi:hypothetical protein
MRAMTALEIPFQATRYALVVTAEDLPSIVGAPAHTVGEPRAAVCWLILGKDSKIYEEPSEDATVIVASARELAEHLAGNRFFVFSRSTFERLTAEGAVLDENSAEFLDDWAHELGEPATSSLVALGAEGSAKLDAASAVADFSVMLGWMREILVTLLSLLDLHDHVDSSEDRSGLSEAPAFLSEEGAESSLSSFLLETFHELDRRYWDLLGDRLGFERSVDDSFVLDAIVASQAEIARAALAHSASRVEATRRGMLGELVMLATRDPAARREHLRRQAACRALSEAMLGRQDDVLDVLSRGRLD